MELIQVYNQFVADGAGELATKISTEYGVNIEGLNFEMSFMPPYLEEFRDDWKAFMCTADEVNMDIQFFFIVNMATMKIVELQMLDLDVKFVA